MLPERGSGISGLVIDIEHEIHVLEEGRIKGGTITLFIVIGGIHVIAGGA